MTGEAARGIMGETRRGREGGGDSFSRALFCEPVTSFANIAPLPSNVAAIEAGLQFVAGRAAFAAILGPSGTGKTHLLRTVAHVGARTLGTPMTVQSAEEFLLVRRGTAEPEVLILDDAQVALGRSRLRQELRRVLEGRGRRGRATMIALNTDPNAGSSVEAPGIRAIHALLPSPRTWTIAAMREPARQERAPLLAHIAGAEGVFLSSALSAILSRELGGNGHALVGAMRRLRLEGEDWGAPTATIRALGLLDPFFNDNSSWDLRHTIAREVERWTLRHPETLQMELACYVMLYEARLCERSVAQFLGRTPAEVYGHAARLRRALEGSAEERARVRLFCNGLIDSLSR